MLYHERCGKIILARMAAILAILSVSRECIGILNIFYKKVFRSAPLRRGDRLILSFVRPCEIPDPIGICTVPYCIYCTVTGL